MTDFDFSPFHDGVLATGGDDCLVHLWRIPEGGVSGSLTTPTATLSHMQVVHIQWNLQTKDTLGPIILSLVERLSPSRR